MDKHETELFTQILRLVDQLDGYTMGNVANLSNVSPADPYPKNGTNIDKYNWAVRQQYTRQMSRPRLVERDTDGIIKEV